MKKKANKIEKLLEENFSHKEDASDEEYEEDNLVKRTVDDILDETIEEFPGNDVSSFNAFKRRTFPGDDILSSKTYSGKRVSRMSLEESENESDDAESDLSESSKINEISKGKKHVTFAYPLSKNESDSRSDDDDHEEMEESENEEEVDEEESDDNESENNEDEDEDESGIEDDLSGDESHDPAFIYSQGVRDESSDRQKGEAIRAQLNLCELLLESRITLQKALFATNQMPRPQNYDKILTECSEEDKNVVTQCRESIWDLLENLLQLQCKFRKQCPEFLETLNEPTRKEYEELDDSEPTIKRQKLEEYPDVLEKLHNDYKPYRNNVLQKWSDRTKAASIRLAKSDFTAFDLPILKQIDQILADKPRLIQRTHIKRAEYKIIGDDETNEDTQENSEPNPNADYDEEIFDDDDFYHKLLRDYIERKTADVSDPTQLGRKWIKLQNLRSKMKRKIDTRRTKGRKIKFDVHPKLVNFMAPVGLNSWTDTAVNELFNSVFGKNLINT